MRRIKQWTVTAISLCKQGKNGLRTLFKADGSVVFETLVKANADNEILVVAYAPERPDDDGDFAEAPIIKEAAHHYLRDHRSIDIEHNGHKLPNDAAYVAESFIVGKGDERFQDWKNYDNEPVGDLTGAWASVIKLEDPVLQKAYREGELDGVSLFGRAAVERVDTKAASKRVAERLGKARVTQENDMDKAEVETMLSSFKAEIVTMLKAVAEPKAPAEPAATELRVPVFTGSASDPKALEAYESELRTFELQKAIASGTLTADKIAEMRKALAVGEPSDAEAGVEQTDTPREKELKRELFKARKTRNAPARGNESPEDSEVELRKANEAEGLAIAKIVNERRGAPAGGMRVVAKA